MPRPPLKLGWIAPCAILALLASTGCAGTIASKPGVYEVSAGQFRHADHSLNVAYVKPEKPRSPALLILFASGDAGWMGTSGKIFTHMADRGYFVAGYNSREVVAHVKQLADPVKVSTAAEVVGEMLVQARHDLGLADSTPVVVTGFSRGASFVVFTTAVESLQHQVGGGVAVALTREFDYLEFPRDKHSPHVQTDEQGRMQTYPATRLIGSIPFAVIQSTGDKYVPAEESRRLFGPDTPTRRLYEVPAKNHGFRGGEEELLRDLDDALAWIEGTERTTPP